MSLDIREKGKFISIVGGKVVHEVPKGTTGPNVRVRVNKNGREVTEEVFDGFTANLLGVKVEESKNAQIGTQWVFQFKDEGDEYILNLGYSNHIALAILKMLPNVDLSKKIQVSVSLSAGDDGIERTSIFLAQDGKNVPYYYKKDVNGLPEKKLVKINGKDSWDYSDQIDFLYKNVLPKLQTGITQPQVSTAPVEEGDGEDIPFN